MATKEERMRILALVEKGVLTPEQGAEMLGALGVVDKERDKQKSASAQPLSGSPQAGNAGNSSRGSVRIRVVNPSGSNGSKGLRGGNVDIRVPVSLVDVLARISDKFIPRDEMPVPIEEVWSAIRNGERGKIVDIQGDDGEIVEITVE